MEDGEIELSDQILLPNSDCSSNIQPSFSPDSFLDDLLRNSQTCTHTHTCNPPGPDAAHTHTCYPTHTHVIPSDEDTALRAPKSPSSKPRRPLGNREAVRKYREKKKAHAAYLEEEVKKLRLMNQILMGKLRRQAILETEVLRLRSLLLDLGGKIENELGDFPFQNNNFREGECGVQSNNLGCDVDGSSVPSSGVSRGGRGSKCQPPTIRCEANSDNVVSGKKCLQE